MNKLLIGSALALLTVTTGCGSAESAHPWLATGDPARYNTPSQTHAQLPARAAPTSTTAALPAGFVTGDGTLIVGTDIQPGTYRTAGPPPGESMPYCYWKRLKGFSGSLDEIITSGVASREGQSQVVTVSASDAAFETSRCQPWQKIR